MSRPRSNSTTNPFPAPPSTLAAPSSGRARRNSQSHIESAISAIRQKNENVGASGNGGYMGGPPGSQTVTRKKSTRARRDPTLYVLNGRRVRTTERICDEVPPPTRHLPTDDQFWSKHDRSRTRPSLSFLKAHFTAQGRLSEDQALYILNATTKIFTSEPNLLRAGDGVTVVGDIHGQFYDLLKLFDIGGEPAETPYLFLGDYVDRGAFGIECLLYLYAHKMHFPNSLFMLRGNHECRHLTEYFTFKKECLHKYSPEVYEACIRSFNALPIAAILDERFLCVHGGIGPDLETIDDFKRVDRFKEPDMDGSLCDILWADPKDDYSRVPAPDEPAPARVRRYATRKGKGREGEEGDLLPVGFTHNNTRGCSFFYDYTAVNRFLNRNNLLSVIRAHEAQDTGYRMYRSTPLNFPSLITIFSAPDYLDAYGNRAAVIKYINRDITIRQFNSVPHPYVLPGHMNAFTWSLPFVGAKITEMLLAILDCCTAEELEESSTDESGDETVAAEAAIRDAYATKKARQEAIKNKILAMGRMAKVFELLREESEGASELGYDEQRSGTASDRSTPFRDTKLTIQNQKISRSINSFDDARKYDIINERLPMSRPSSPSYVAPTPTHAHSYATEYTHRTISPSPSNASRPPTPDVPSPSTRRHSNEERIRRALLGEDEDEDDRELVKLANRLAGPLTKSKDVRKAYGVREGHSRVKLRRTDTT